MSEEELKKQIDAAGDTFEQMVIVAVKQFGAMEAPLLYVCVLKKNKLEMVAIDYPSHLLNYDVGKELLFNGYIPKAIVSIYEQGGTPLALFHATAANISSMPKGMKQEEVTNEIRNKYSKDAVMINIETADSNEIRAYFIEPTGRKIKNVEGDEINEVELTDVHGGAKDRRDIVIKGRSTGILKKAAALFKPIHNN